MQAFNRTIVELKLIHYKCQSIKNLTFNRTIVELKHEPLDTNGTRNESFNRTIVELKPLGCWSKESSAANF